MASKENKIDEELLEYHQQLLDQAHISADANDSLPEAILRV